MFLMILLIHPLPSLHPIFLPLPEGEAERGWEGEGKLFIRKVSRLYRPALAYLIINLLKKLYYPGGEVVKILFTIATMAKAMTIMTIPKIA